MKIPSFFFAFLFFSLCLIGAQALVAEWEDDLGYIGGGIDYLMVRPETGLVRISGGGIREWKQLFKAGGFNNGPNGIPENGGGDDVFLGVLHSGVTWSTAVPPQVGQIRESSGWFLSGSQTGEGDVIATYPGATQAVVFVRVYPPDWQPGNSRVESEGEGNFRLTRSMDSGAVAGKSDLQISNFPNPFNPSTTFAYRVPEGTRSPISLEVYSMRGQRVATLVDEIQVPGEYRVQWGGVNDRGEKVTSGIYLYRLIVGGETQVRKMTILK